MQKSRLGNLIVSIVAILLLSALVLMYINQNKAEYLPDTTPQNVVHNYVLSLNQENYERAYNYLSSEHTQITLTDFEQALSERKSEIKNSNITISRILDGDDAIVLQLNIRKNYESSLLTDPDLYNEFGQLVKENGEWKISSMPEPYWPEEWLPEF